MYQNKKYSEETKKYFKIIKVENFQQKVKRKYQKRLLVKNILKKEYNKTQNYIKIIQKKLEKKCNGMRGRKFQKKHRKRLSTTKGEPSPVYGKKYSKETKEYVSSLNIGKTSSPETKKLLSNINSVPKHKVLQKEVFKRSKKQ